MTNLIKAVLLDLDGTLLDTAGDLGRALNELLQAQQLPHLPLPTIRPSAGRGLQGLLKLGFNMDRNHPEYGRFCERLLDYYQQHLFDTTAFFPGMEETLRFLDDRQIPWGIVTNKPERYTSQLIRHLQLDKRARCVISGDSLAQRKPHPEPILHACQILQQSPAHCLYVGDSLVDMQASKHAGTVSLAALYGYISEEDDPQSWGADGYIQHPLDIINWIA